MIKLNTALKYYENGNFIKAKKVCEEILKKNLDDYSTAHLLGKIEFACKNYKDAIAILKKLLVKDSKNHQILIDLGDSYDADQNLYMAVECYHEAINLKSTDDLVYAKCASVLIKLKQYQLGLNLYSKAYYLNTSNNSHLIGIANANDMLGNFEIALEIYRKVLVQEPLNVAALLLKGEIYRKIGKYQESINCAEAVLSISSKETKALLLRGVTRKDQGLFESALQDYRLILDINPGMEGVKYNIGLIYLAQAKYNDGWMYYESRWRTGDFKFQKLASNRPSWNKEKKGKLLVWAEQGIGDEIMFSSMLNEVASDIETLIVMVDKRLITLFERSFNKSIKFIDSKMDLTSVDYDYQIPMGSLCMFYRKEEASFINVESPYLIPDQNLIDKYRGLINLNSARKIIGISWKSSNPINGLKRGVSLLDLIEKYLDKNTYFLNLQYGDVSDEIEELKEKKGVELINIKDVDNMRDIEGLASLIMNCDEVISIDNSTVHLAGALGKKTSVLLPENAEWRWQLNRTDTPWYPSLTLFRKAIN
jgi:tetratricopeptide (TPR) repeat protein